MPTSFQRALLKNEVRARIVSRLQSKPRLNKSQVCKELDIYANLGNFHLTRLEEAGIVIERPGTQGAEVLCFMRRDAHLWDDSETRVMFGRRPTRDVGLYVAENPGSTTKQVAASVDRSPITIRHHLRTLRGFELAEQRRLVRRVTYHPSQKLVDWTRDVGSYFDRPW